MSSLPFLSGLFSSFPSPFRHLFDKVLKIDQIRDLHTHAARRCPCRLSRSVLDLLDIRIRCCPGELKNIPQTGPVIVVANHPFGIIDGLLLDALLGDIREDVKLLTNRLIAGAEEIGMRCIPVDVFQSRTSSVNLRAVRQTREWLEQGHGIVMFPAGEVSHWRPEHGCISDPPWSDLAARFAVQAKATVVPIYFTGANSVRFQLAGLLHPRFRTIQLPAELLNKRGHKIAVRVGHSITAADLMRQKTAKGATAYLRARTYILAHRSERTGIQTPKRPLLTVCNVPRQIAEETPGIPVEIEQLKARGCKILENAVYAVYAERGERMPIVMREIGRLRELTFREVGEGTGQALDLDRFDPHYTQLVLWHKVNRCIGGAYRLAWTEDVLPGWASSGLYTSTLFHYAPEFFRGLGPAVELGRTFIRAEFQKDYAPLLLLWQGIGRLVASRPQAPVLFGAVSISASYSNAATALMVEHLRQHRLRGDLAPFVKPRRPFRSRLTRAPEIRIIAACFEDMEELSSPLSEMGEQGDIPVLLRHYIRLGGRVAAFHVDPRFSNVTDGLLIVDLRESAPKLLAKYMGRENASQFLHPAHADGRAERIRTLEQETTFSRLV